MPWPRSAHVAALPPLRASASGRPFERQRSSSSSSSRALKRCRCIERSYAWLALALHRALCSPFSLSFYIYFSLPSPVCLSSGRVITKLGQTELDNIAKTIASAAVEEEDLDEEDQDDEDDDDEDDEE